MEMTQTGASSGYFPWSMHGHCNINRQLGRLVTILHNARIIPVTSFYQNTMKRKLLVLVDGSHYLFRAYHALPELKNDKGEQTGAIYGVISMLRKLIRGYSPDYFAVVFDAKGKTFRNDLYADYKANRPEMPEELAAQIEPLHRIIRDLGIPLLMIDSVEADDVIGTLAKRAELENMDVLISSGDKDLAQLVNDRIKMINSMKNIVIDADGVREKYGVRPDQIIDYLTLVGDAVDNIPGVNKVGPKTAAKWLKEYGTLETIIEHADEFRGKVGEYLRDSLEQLPLSKQLVTLKCDIDLDLRPEDLVTTKPDNNKIRQHYERWQFRSLLDAAGFNDTGSEGEDNRDQNGDPPADCTCETILHQAELDEWIKALQEADLFAFDTETTSLNYAEAEIVGVSFAIQPGRAAYLPLGHDYDGAPVQLDRDNTLQQLQPLLENESRPKVGHNLKYDMNVLHNHGITLRGCRHDTMLQSYVLNSTASRHDMDTLAEKHLQKKTIHYEDVAGKGARQISFNQVPVEQAAPYAAEDADVTLRLHRHLWPQLTGIKPLQSLYECIEIPLMPVLSRMESYGVMIDADLLRRQSRQLTALMEDAEEEIFREAGQSFNIGSPKQIQAILYDKMNLPVLAKTPGGQPSTAESVLQELAVRYELPKLILDHRSLSKLKSTYTDKLPELVNSKTRRIHTSYHQAVAATGRLSSSDPNLQNIPIRTEQGRQIRQAFIAASGYGLLAADYSQIELRIMAHLSGDKRLLDAFARGEDIHRLTASEVFDTPADKITADQRRAAKAINFGLIYGMSAFGLAKQLAISRGQAADYVDRYFERYPGVKRYMDRTRETAREQGYVETLFHRRLYLPEIKSRNAARRQYAERTAINAPMQGTAADIIKRAMIAVDQWLQSSALDARLIMQVHDELVFEIHNNMLAEAEQEIRKIMAAAAELNVPLIVDIGSGKNWDEAH